MRSISIINRLKKRAIGLFTAVTVLSLSLVLSPAAGALSIGGPSDCDNNAIISCGAHSTSALMSAYNGSAYVRKVYAYFGISSADMANLPSTNVAGTVTRSGAVIVSGKTVATNAVTGGRQNMPGSTQVNFQGAVFFKRPPSVSFQQSSLPAFVSMKNGVFQFAVIASCGNAVSAHPTTTPPQKAAVAPARPVSKPPAKPQAKPQQSTPTQTQTQIQAQQQEVNINNSNAQTVQPAPQASSESTPSETSTAAAPTESTPEQTASQPSSLVNTGPAGTVGVFLAATGLGTIAYRRFVLRRILG